MTNRLFPLLTIVLVLIGCKSTGARALADGESESTSTVHGCPEQIALPPEVTPPRLIHRVEIDSEVARRQKGVVCVRATVGLDGKLKNLEVVRTTNEFLAKEFLRSLSELRYEPATKEGNPVEVLEMFSVAVR